MTRMSIRLALAMSIAGLGLSLGSASPEAQSPERGAGQHRAVRPVDGRAVELGPVGRRRPDRGRQPHDGTRSAARRRPSCGPARRCRCRTDFLTEEAVDAAEPYVLQMNVNPEGQNSGDRVEVYFHGVTYSHLDGLCHVFYKDKLYNGLDFRDVVTEDGCSLMDTTQMEGRPRDARRARRHAPAEGRAVPRAGHEAVPRGHRGVGGVRRGAARPGRRAAPAHRPLGLPRGGGTDARDVGVGRLGHPVPGRARHRAARGRLGARGAGQRAGPARQPHPPVRDRRARDEPARQHRPRRSGRDGGPAQPLGVHAGGGSRCACPAARGRR